MYTKIQPLFDRVVIEMGAPAEDPVGLRVVIPDKYKLPPNEGRVISVGAGRYENGHLIPMTVKPGDLVLVQELRGIDFHADDKVLRIVEEGAIMAIIKRSSVVLPS